MADGAYVESEIGVLESVIVHSPGIEIEAMTPSTFGEVLYNDIIPRGVVATEHRALCGVLARFAEVREFTELLRDVLALPRVRAELIDAVVLGFALAERRQELLGLSVDELLRVLIGGLPVRKDTLASYLANREFDLHPLPNLYFTRDCAMLYRGQVMVGAMAHQVRRLEALLASFLFRYHPALRPDGVLFDGSLENVPGVTLEGGDFELIAPDLLVMGLSDRTSAQAIDLIADRIATGLKQPLRIFAVLLPPDRATIHLDMVFTQIDHELALVYAPHVIGKDRRPVVRVEIDPRGRRQIDRVDGLFEGLASAGVRLEPVLCGGGAPVHEEREQWLSGTNFLAVAPGKIIGYDCNESTLRALERVGFAVCAAADLLAGRESPAREGRLVIGIEGVELARGGGGVRCMTLPVRRRPFAPA